MVTPIETRDPELDLTDEERVMILAFALVNEGAYAKELSAYLTAKALTEPSKAPLAPMAAVTVFEKDTKSLRVKAASVWRYAKALCEEREEDADHD